MESQNKPRFFTFDPAEKICGCWVASSEGALRSFVGRAVVVPNLRAFFSFDSSLPYETPKTQTSHRNSGEWVVDGMPLGRAGRMESGHRWSETVHQLGWIYGPVHFMLYVA